MICPDCRGSIFDDGEYTMAQVLGGEAIVLHNVPASRCRQCGYDIISGETAKRIEDALRKPVTGTAVVPAYDLAEKLDYPLWIFPLESEMSSNWAVSRELLLVGEAGTVGVR